MSDVLVVYFSRSGVTERLARQLAAKVGADLDRIETSTSYRGAGGFVKGIVHSLFRHEPAETFKCDPAKYSTVLLGSPVWAGRLSAPARSFLKAAGRQIGSVATFTVSGGGRSYKETIGAEVEQLVGVRPMAMATFAAREVGSSSADAKLNALAEALKNPSRKVA